MERTHLYSETRIGDCAKILKTVPSDSIHMVLSDPPYGIDLDDWDVIHANTNSALGGKSPQQQKLGSGFARRGKPINGWSKADAARSNEYGDWCNQWLPELKRVLLPGGSAILFGGRRTIHRLTLAAEDAGFACRDLLAWRKNRGHFKAQSLSKLYEKRGDQHNTLRFKGWRLGNLAPVFEPICWLQKPYKVGGTIADNMIMHGVGAMRPDDENSSNMISGDFAPGEAGLHPAQKPISILKALIELVTQPGQTILDPFMGSGSTGVAAQSIGRSFVGIESSKHYFDLANSRLQEVAYSGRNNKHSSNASLF